MSEQIILLLCVAGLVGLIHIPAVVLVMRAQRALVDSAGARFREEDRARRDLYDTLLRLMEKQECHPTHAMQQHASERMERMRMETSLQREEVRQPRETPPPAQGGGPVEDMVLAMD